MRKSNRWLTIYFKQAKFIKSLVTKLNQTALLRFHHQRELVDTPNNDQRQYFEQKLKTIAPHFITVLKILNKKRLVARNVLKNPFGRVKGQQVDLGECHQNIKLDKYRVTFASFSHLDLRHMTIDNTNKANYKYICRLTPCCESNLAPTIAISQYIILTFHP